GCEPAARAFRQALALFPGSQPPFDGDLRLHLYRRGEGSQRHQIDTQFWDAQDEIIRCLAAYIRARPEAFAHLKEPPTKRAKVRKKKRRPKGATRKRKTARSPGLKSLPHWARVAFAARCGRHVLPLFTTHWPTALLRRRAALVWAIELAEQSAAEGRPQEGLKEAQMQAVMTAGAALGALYGVPAKEPLPPDGNAGANASFVAKVAEKVAEAAGADPEHSVDLAMEAFAFALQIVKDVPALGEAMTRDSALLYRLAREGNWTDQTAVPATVWQVDGPAR